MSGYELITNPLNPLLYQALCQFDGGVIVANEGVRSYPNTRTTVRNNRVVCELSYTTGAEHYRINCPYCRDKRHRLWINYMYGTVSPLTRDVMRWQLFCYNEDCLKDYDLQQDFWTKLEDAFRGRAVSLAAVAEAPTQEAGLVYTPLPGYTVPVNTLPESEAGSYLRGRGYNLDTLAECYDIRVFVEPPEGKAWLRGWIVIPITQEKLPIGWQARYPGDKDWKQEKVKKFYNLPGMKKHLMLYNADNARRYRTVVVVEGATSAWKVGGPVVALFGKSCSPQQRTMLLEWDSIVLMLDADDASAQKKMQELYDTLSPHKPTCQVRLPQGLDPGKQAKEQNWKLIRQQAKQQGVPLWLDRRSV